MRMIDADGIRIKPEYMHDICGVVMIRVEDIARILNDMPSVDPERLTDDDFETIRIHLSAYKERLCNQRRWKEAEEYQRIIDRFVSFASAEPEITRCKDCKYWTHIKRTNRYWCKTDDGLFDSNPSPDDFCSRAERRTE